MASTAKNMTALHQNIYLSPEQQVESLPMNCLNKYDFLTEEQTRTFEQTYPELLIPNAPNSQKPEGSYYFSNEFIALLSHEFRTPLNDILGMSEALLEEVFGTMTERQLNAVTTIERSGGYLWTLMNNLVELSKIQGGEVVLEIANVAVADLCQSSIAAVKHYAIQKQIQLEANIPTNAGNIAVDLQRMQQALIHLLNHAIGVTPMGGKVDLVVTPPSVDSSMSTHPMIQFSVIDTSKEISPPQQDVRTKPLQNMPQIGFGLMLVNPIVKLHNGALSYESAIGRGSCITISLPYTNTNFLPTGEYLDSSGPLSTGLATLMQEMPEPPLILIVEDNALNINTLYSYLTAKGYRPIIAQDGQSAVELAKMHHPAMILMDIQMPIMDGFEAITRIRQDADIAKTPIIALTALAMDGDREKCLASGANEYLAKPIKLKQLNQMIQKYLFVQE